MATAVQKITLAASRDIPFNKLLLSQSNVRRVKAGVSIPGGTAADNRLFVDGVLWVLRSGAHWRDMPERYGTWKTAYKRFSRWAAAGVWERVFADLTKDRDNQHLMLDATLVRAHQQATTGRGSGSKRGLDPAVGRSRGGVTIKVHMACDDGL